MKLPFGTSLFCFLNLINTCVLSYLNVASKGSENQSQTYDCTCILKPQVSFRYADKCRSGRAGLIPVHLQRPPKHFLWDPAITDEKSALLLTPGWRREVSRWSSEPQKSGLMGSKKEKDSSSFIVAPSVLFSSLSYTLYSHQCLRCLTYFIFISVFNILFNLFNAFYMHKTSIQACKWKIKLRWYT